MAVDEVRPGREIHTMTTLQITMSDTERAVLRAMAERTGKREEELVHEAIEQYRSRMEIEERRAVLRRVWGLWKDREDLPDSEELRAEMK
jgi:hypothetical protein